MEENRQLLKRLLDILITEKTMTNRILCIKLYKNDSILLNDIIGSYEAYYLPNLDAIDSDIMDSDEIQQFLAEYEEVDYDDINKKKIYNYYLQCQPIYGYFIYIDNGRIDDSSMHYNTNIEKIKNYIIKCFNDRTDMDMYEDVNQSLHFVLKNVLKIILVDVDRDNLDDDEYKDMTEYVFAKFESNDNFIYNNKNEIIHVVEEGENKHNIVYSKTNIKKINPMVLPMVII